MRQKLTAVLMMTLLLLLSACGRGETALQEGLELRSRLREAGGCSFTARIVTEVEERGYAFTLSCVYRCDGVTELTVTAPETIRGIRAELTDTDAVLSFDDVSLDFGTLHDAMETPLYAPLVLGRSWDTAYLDCGGMDGERYRLTTRLGYETDELIVETWLEDGLPVQCEIYAGETLLLSALVEDFTFSV